MSDGGAGGGCRAREFVSRHFCVGHDFSRALIRIALELLLQRFPWLALDPDRPPEFRGWEFRAPRRLDVAL
jgi:cytochrome P450